MTLLLLPPAAVPPLLPHVSPPTDLPQPGALALPRLLATLGLKNNGGPPAIPPAPGDHEVSVLIIGGAVGLSHGGITPVESIGGPPDEGCVASRRRGEGPPPVMSRFHWPCAASVRGVSSLLGIELKSLKRMRNSIKVRAECGSSCMLQVGSSST